MDFETKFKRNKGITLIALVVTIIVLLILAGVSINMLTGQNGILNRASEAKNKTTDAQNKEELEFALSQMAMEYHLNGGAATFSDYIFAHEDDLKAALGTSNVSLNSEAKTITLATSLTISGETTVASGAKIDLTVAQGGGNEEIEWSVNDKSKATVVKKDDSKATVTGVSEGAAVITATAKNSGKTATYSITVTAPKFSDYSWTDINALAKEIAKDNTITNQTVNVTKTINGKEYSAKVGDEKTITIASKDYKVRILGFNHDTLESGATAYNDSSITKAGISFEFKTLLPTAQMNSTDTNADGWGASLMRTNLNSTSAVSGMVNLSDIESVIGSNIIKSVTKSYIKEFYDKNSVTQCNDKLWLLACSEIIESGGFVLLITAVASFSAMSPATAIPTALATRATLTVWLRALQSNTKLT